MVTINLTCIVIVHGGGVPSYNRDLAQVKELLLSVKDLRQFWRVYFTTFGRLGLVVGGGVEG